MHSATKAFVQFCKNNLTIETDERNNYASLSVCIIDCVYSLRTKYYSVTLPIVERYAQKYMDGDACAAGDTVSMLLQRIEAIGGPKKFADEVLKNH